MASLDSQHRYAAVTRVFLRLHDEGLPAAQVKSFLAMHQIDIELYQRDARAGTLLYNAIDGGDGTHAWLVNQSIDGVLVWQWITNTPQEAA